MKISIPVYVVAIVASFLYALLKQYFPDLSLTQEQIVLILVAILALFNIDVVNAIRKANPGLLERRK